MEKTSFKGRVFMTHPTKAILKWTLSDYTRVSNVSADDQLYDERDLTRAYDRIEAIDFHQVVEVEGVRFTAYNAGHVLGAAMFMIEIAGVKLLYTGDYSYEEDRHLMAAEKPEAQPDVLVCEATYGIQNHAPRSERESHFTTLVHEIVQRGGRCLIPIFALGRAQELLLILDEYWQTHPELHSIPVYYASNMARKCMAVYQTYINMMNSHIRNQFVTSNPFIFKHISNLRSMEHFDDVGPCVMMASPAMLQSGLSRQLLEMWCTDKKNGVIIPGYVVENTLAKTLLTEPADIQSMSGAKLPLRCTVDYISFSAHVDYTQNREFIESVNAQHLVLVHGETNMMFRLRQALTAVFTEKDVKTKIYSPKNAEMVSLHFRGQKLAKAIGSLAASVPNDGAHFTGVLVGKDYQYRILTPSDLSNFTELQTAVIKQRQYVPFQSGTWHLVIWHLELVFPGSIQEVKPAEEGSFVKDELTELDVPPKSVQGALIKREKERVMVCGIVTVINGGKCELIVEWDGNMVNDLIGDSVLSILLQMEASPTSVKLTSKRHSHEHNHNEKDQHIHDGSAPVNDDGKPMDNENQETSNDNKHVDDIKMEDIPFVESENKSSKMELDEKLLIKNEDAEMTVPSVPNDSTNNAKETFISRLLDVLCQQIEDIVRDDETDVIRGQTVICDHELLRTRIENIVRRLHTIIMPAALTLE